MIYNFGDGTLRVSDDGTVLEGSATEESATARTTWTWRLTAQQE